MSHVDALLSLLDDERRLILDGDLLALPKLGLAKEQALSELRHHTPSQSQLVRIQTVLARNQRLLSAAANGIRAAQNRIDAIRNPDRSVKTYTRAGAAQTIAPTPSSFEKRA
ncbi:hypothetical protein SAMN04488030_3382 [Aliiroseovarius halocynthiae]|uniref:Flagellar biosynthesis protein FlgN n=1 Tax=Aliiroseovarius halocynthiae TaxID=985055 RepID=A0A545SM40_9RHOB|nr:flagellar biosynthesis protein FlgN [Aliiroseovarius halocynthiae]TQV65906.1 flagellar biosynthesis protein FlgN [Aliiroseovarius halocynthiae]SMR83462.1 hypothetical protein SAMN04488030_3382 [Aliiroseovarius halocynthiae]